MAQPAFAKKGYVMLITMLIISAVGLAISISSILLGLGFSNSSFSLEKSAKAKYYSSACAEVALQAIWDSDFTGSDNLSFADGSCLYEVIDLGGDNRTINAIGVSGTVTRKNQISIDQLSPFIRITAWQEVAD
jgi:hypothetical protein